MVKLINCPTTNNCNLCSYFAAETCKHLRFEHHQHYHLSPSAASLRQLLSNSTSAPLDQQPRGLHCPPWPGSLPHQASQRLPSAGLQTQDFTPGVNTQNSLGTLHGVNTHIWVTMEIELVFSFHEVSTVLTLIHTHAHMTFTNSSAIGQKAARYTYQMYINWIKLIVIIV